MSISSIGSGVLQTIQTTSNVNNTSQNYNDTGSSQAIAHGHQHGGSNEFMQNVLQSLQSLGLNLSSITTSASNNTSTAATSSSTSASVAPTGTNAQQALFSLLHDLHQALTQAGGSQNANQALSSQGTDNDGDHDNSAKQPNAIQATYGNASNNLSNLISSLANNSSGSSSATANTLQTDFNNLVQALGGGTSKTASASTPPTLQSFLEQLQGNLSQNNAVVSSSSNFIKTQA